MLYNNKKGIFLFIILFLLWSIVIGKNCPCDKKSKYLCIRHEYYGVQMNHFILFIIIGFIFPSYFFTFMILGIIWELYEYILDHNEAIVNKYIGGCLSERPHNSLSKNYIFKGETKYLNPIDRFFNIQNSKNHMWHGSVAELVPNVGGFIIGYVINYIINMIITNN